MPHQATYFHGTSAYNAWSILRRGFVLEKDKMTHGSARGMGTYVTHLIENTLVWGQYVVECRLREGTRILWVDGKFDPRIIQSLSREFGRELLDGGPDVLKFLPRNKRLQSDELFHLANYIYHNRLKKGFVGDKVKNESKWWDLRGLNRLIKKHKFDGVGEMDESVWDGDEVLIYNPSNVIPIKVLRIVDNAEGLAKLTFRDSCTAAKTKFVVEEVPKDKLEWEAKREERRDKELERQFFE